MVFGAGGMGCVGSFFDFFHVSHRLRGGRRYGGNLDSVKDEEIVQEKEGRDNHASPALGVVARLMGLDTMPEQVTVDSWGVRGRSRSMSSVERQRSQVSGCLNKSSSFHQPRSFWLPYENDGFWILNFGDDDGDGNKKRKETKIEACLVTSEEEGFHGRRTKIDSDSSSQNSSPVSVLDRDSVHQVSGSNDGYCSRTDGEENPNEVSSKRNVTRTVEDHRNNNNQPSSSSSLVGCWDEICRLALEDVKIERWVIGDWMKKNYYLEDLAIEIEMKMIDFLVQEYVEELYHTFLEK
ncbi:hypothetical protein ZOSMA_3G01190 [Zostera marina]|uniref:DUF3741 domain-containing protein n=1 Tax=Zostera marina TaxID=29655 RepID=A0A0K9P610_ZOSMR|nr:hypothetical protein ZOSMA_3G01190 [Zostera marina]